jgi:hypothetical protein
MAELFKNLASTTLSGAIDDSQTSINVASAMGFTSGNFRTLVENELMLVTAVSGTTLTVTRHMEGTTATAHADATPVYHVLTPGALDARETGDLSIYDSFANRPAAGVPGRLFLPTDGVFIERDNGSTWDKFGPIWPLTPPQLSDFPTWVNQGTSTSVDNKGAIYLEAITGNSENLRARVKTYPTPPFTVEMAFLPVSCIYTYGSGVGAGLCIRDSVGGKMQVYGVSNSDFQINGSNYSSYSARSGAVANWPNSGSSYQLSSQPIWIKYADDGVNYRTVSISADGYNWAQMVQNSRADYLTPDQIGICVNSLFGYPYYWNGGCTFIHWKQY